MSITRSLLLRALPVVLMLGVAGPAMAQDAPANELSVGYNLLRVSEDEGEEFLGTMGAGWYVDYARNVTPMFGVVGQITGNYKTIEDDDFPDFEVDSGIHSFMGGVRVSSRANPQFVPFAQVLFGAIRASFSSEDFDIDESETDGALQIGGGVNFMGAGSIGLRVGVDYLRVFTDEEGTNAFRFAAGVVFGF